MAKKTNDGMVWGIILVTAGVIFLLQKMFNIEILGTLWQFWPVLLIIWGVIVIRDSRK
jgi:hypothetical protein